LAQLRADKAILGIGDIGEKGYAAAGAVAIAFIEIRREKTVLNRGKAGIIARKMPLIGGR